MGRPLGETEFYTIGSEIWYREGTESRQLREMDYEKVDWLCEQIETFYPKAYAALGEQYRGCMPNVRYYRWRIASRFVRCNFGIIDDRADVDAEGRMQLEWVPCPMRGECRQEGVICKPEYAHRLSAAEQPVMELWYQGHSIEDISEQLCLSPHTVHNHIRHAYARTGLHSRAEFVKYADQNGLYHERAQV